MLTRFAHVQHERESRKSSNAPLLSAPMTSELGNVTPYIVVPGAWPQDQLEHKTSQIVEQMRDNAGCNCLAPRVLVLPHEWPLVRSLHRSNAFRSEVHILCAPHACAATWNLVHCDAAVHMH